MEWHAQFATRLRVQTPLKAFGTMAYIALFFVAYFWLLRNPMFEVFTMPVTTMDHLIPFSSNWLPVYLSLWIYVSLAPALIADRPGLLRYGTAAAILCLTGLAIFALWPSTIPIDLVDWDKHKEMAFLQGMDVAGNACPSMHVASTVFSGLWMHRLFIEIRAPSWLRALNIVWGMAVIYSTMAVKQHVFLDVLGGFVLGTAVALPSIRWHALSVHRIALSPASPQ